MPRANPTARPHILTIHCMIHLKPAPFAQRNGEIVGGQVSNLFSEATAQGIPAETGNPEQPKPPSANH